MYLAASYTASFDKPSPTEILKVPKASVAGVPSAKIDGDAS